MTTEKIIETYQKEFIRLSERYNKLHDTFDSYRGKRVEDEQKINNLLDDIQDTFQSLKPFLTFVVKNYDVCRSGITGYQLFIDDLKRAGAVPIDEVQS
jgi:hypothetical protein